MNFLKSFDLSFGPLLPQFAGGSDVIESFVALLRSPFGAFGCSASGWKNRGDAMIQQRKSLDFFEAPPNCRDSEMYVVCAILTACQDDAAETLDIVARIVKPDDFYTDPLQRIYRSLLALRDNGEPIELQSLHGRLTKNGELEAVGGAAYLREVLQEIALPSHAEHYAKIVAEKASLRRAAFAAASIISEIESPTVTTASIRKLLSEAQNELDRRLTSRLCDARTWALDGVSSIEKVLEPAIPTGIRRLDELLVGGFRPKNLIVVAARPRVGKTVLTTNIIRNICFQGRIPTLFFSLEMSRDEIFRRCVSDLSGVSHSRILEAGRLTKADWKKIGDAAELVARSPFCIDDSAGATLPGVFSTIRFAVRKHGAKVVFVDQCSLVAPELQSKVATKRDEFSAVAIGLKKIARELGVTVILIAQLNRSSVLPPRTTKLDERQIRALRPTMEGLKESGSLEEVADVVLLLNRPELCAPREDAARLGLVGYAEAILAKNRHGETGIVPMRFEGSFLRFVEQDESGDDFGEEWNPGGDTTGVSDEQKQGLVGFVA